MPQMQDEAGNVWEVDAQGNPLGLVSQGGQPPVDPKYKFEGQIAGNKAASTAYDADLARDKLASGAADRQLDREKFEFDKRKVAVEETASMGLTPAQKKVDEEFAKEYTEFRARGGYADVQKNLSQLQEALEVLKNSDTITGPVIGRMPEFMQQAINSEVINTREGVEEVVQRNLRLILGAQFTEKEGERLISRAFNPKLQEGDNVTRLERLIGQIGGAAHAKEDASLYYEENGTLAGWKPENSNIGSAGETQEGAMAGVSNPYKQRPTDQTPQRMVDGRGGGMAPAQNGYETVDNPELAGLNNEVMQMLLSGSDTGSIAEHIKGRGVNPLPMLEAIQANVDIQKTNPGIKPQINLDDMSRAISPERQALSNVADSGFGAYGVGAANMLTAGTLDELAGGNAQQTKEYLGNQYPGATLAGNISGGALAMAPIGRATQALTGLNAGKAALAGDVAYGAATGAGEFNDDRLMGAGLGAVGAGIGNKLGTGISNSLGRATRGVTDKAVNKLNNSGVPMTLGQMVGEGGLVGRSIKAMEDGLESVPVLGSAIKGQRKAGIEKWNTAVFKDGLKPIGETVPDIGPKGIEQALLATNKGYDDALRGVSIPADEQFGAEVARANTLGSTTPDFGAQYTNIVDRKIAPIAAGADNIDGRQFQQLRRTAEGYGRKYDKVANGPTPQPMAEDVSAAFMGIRDALDGTVERNAPGVLPAYQNANKAYGNVMTLKDAVSRSRNGTRSGEAGLMMPSQLNDAAESTAKKFGNKGGTTQRPFYELGEAGQKVLPSNIGNSGTVDRALAAAALPAALGGAGYATGLVDPETAMLIAAAGAPYTGVGRKLTQKALLQRPQAMIDAGNAIMKRNRLGGVFGASTGLGLLPR